MPSTRRAFLGGALGLATASLAACSDGSPRGSSPEGQDALVYANAASAPTLDPSVTANLETSRISSQVLETLVAPSPDTGDPQKNLAESWEVSRDGLQYTFRLRRGVRFHDGTPLTAQAVAENFRRWENNTRRTQVNQTTYQTIFRSSTADGKKQDSIYTSCIARDEHTVVLTVSEKYTPLLKALTQPAFGIGSPRAFADQDAYAKHPVGTGPFRLESWDGNTAELKRFEKYWGEHAQLASLTFRTVTDSAKRYYELVRGSVHAYDQVGISDFVSLARGGYQIQQRDPYAVAYVSINQAHPVMKAVQARRAVAHAIDRSALVKGLYPNGTSVADDFVPQLFMMGNDGNHGRFDHNSDRAQELLAEIGYTDEPIRFYYPTGVSLAALQQPEAVYARIAADLVNAGFRVEPVPIPWNEGYLEKINAEDDQRALALNGLMGTYRDPDDFISPLFRHRIPQFGVEDPTLFAAVQRASAMEDGSERTALYQKINGIVGDHLAAVPFAYPISAVALSPTVLNFPLSATGVNDFAQVSRRS